MLGGQTPNRGLASMEPLTLDLERFYWRCWHAHQFVPRRAYAFAAAPHLAARIDHLPAPRQRMAAARVSRRWLLVVGGSSGEVWEALEGSEGGNLLCTSAVCPRSQLDDRHPYPVKHSVLF